MSEDLASVVSQRLAQLRSDFAGGERDLARLEEQRETLRVALLRISGAIQVLTELSETLPAAEAAPALVDVSSGSSA
jgi:phage shock protein A